MRRLVIVISLAVGLLAVARRPWTRWMDELRTASDRAMLAVLRATSGFEAELKENRR